MDNNISIKKSENVIPSYVVYALYILSVFSGGTAGFVGLIVAYVCHSDSDIIRTHRQYQIRQFWMTFLYIAIAMLTFFAGFGIFIALAAGLWSLVRSIVGLKCLYQNKPIPNPKTWWM